MPAILIAITLHELAHGYMAYQLGDPTAYEDGRLTLNPISHIDIVGFLLLFIVGFGWAKPVPINPRYFKKRKIGTLLVSLAGPVTNFILALFSAIIFVSGIIENNIILSMLRPLIFINIALGVFNLLPFPPLDGSKIVASLLPNKLEYLFYKYEKYLYLILILLVLTNNIERILGPLVQISFNTLNDILNMIF
ncbi:MAG: site-2 protease family protein [Firmicutes bacterium]|nr:site-2 protease family protein [Bacillota bacterium]